MRKGSWPSVFLILAFAIIIAACHGKTIVLVGDFANAFGVSQSRGSWIVSSVAIIAALASPLITWVISVIGERKSIIIGLLIASVSSYWGSLAQSFDELLVLRIIEGAGYINVVLSALALLIHTTEGKKRTTALAFWSVASPLGGAIAIFAVSPLVGGGWRTAFSGHAIILLLLLLAVPLLPAANLASKGERKPFRDIYKIYGNKSIIKLALAVGAPLTIALGLVTIIPHYLISVLHVDPAFMGVISTINIMSSVVAGVFAGYVLNLKKIGTVVVVVSPVIASALKIFFFTPGLSAPTAITIIIIQGFFSSFLVAWVFTSIPKMSLKGDVMGAGGVAEQFLYLSMFLGPVILFPLYSLESPIPFFAAIIAANVLPLFLIPLSNKGHEVKTESIRHG